MNRLGHRTLALWSGIIMIIVVMSGALLILFTDAFSDRLYGNKRVFFIIMLLAYAVYRGFRLRQLLRTPND